MKELLIRGVGEVNAKKVESICSRMGLDLKMKGSLKSIPDNTHWHFKKGKEAGVLEITWLIETNEIILSNKENRKGKWIEEAMKDLRKTLMT